MACSCTNCAASLAEAAAGMACGFHGSSDQPAQQGDDLRSAQDLHRSFNFDPRSVLWNTEVGVLVDSPSWPSTPVNWPYRAWRQR
jgi:hypothetical protein